MTSNMKRAQVQCVLAALLTIAAGCGKNSGSEASKSGGPVTTSAPAASGEGQVLVMEERYPNGTVQVRYEGKLGPDKVFIKHGVSSEFDENGQKIGEMTYVDGVVHGTITLWHPNGEKNGVGYFENGEKEGVWEIWDDQGRKIREESYKDNVNDGMWVYWDEEGNVTHYETWVRGERQLETKGPSPAITPPTTQPAAVPPPVEGDATTTAPAPTSAPTP